MKKTLSLFAMLTVLIGAVTMVTSCGAKIQADSVWKVTKAGSMSIPENQSWYVGFSADGKVYHAYMTDKKLYKLMGFESGDYTAKNGKIKMPMTSGLEYSYTLKNNVLTIYVGTTKVVAWELTKVESPSFKEVKDAKSLL